MSENNGNVWRAIRSQQWFAQATALGFAALLGVIALVLFLRAVSGGLATALTPGQFLLTVGIALAPALIIRALYSGFAVPATPAMDRWAEILVLYGPTLALAILLVSITLPGQNPLAVFTGAMLVLLEEGGAFFICVRAKRSAELERPQRTGRVQAAAQDDSPQQPGDAPVPDASLDELVQSQQPVQREQSAGDVVQELRRIALPDGSQQWQGRCRTRFTPSSRHAVEHLSFCPPFPHTPRVQCRTIDGPPARVRVGRVLPYGASVELRLAQVCPVAAWVTFEFTATVASRGT